MSTLVITAGLLFIAAIIFMNTNAATLAKIIRNILPVTLLLSGAALIFLKQMGPGSLLLFAGISLWRRFRGVGKFGPKGSRSSSGQKVSSVRSAALEMELDHDSGAMNGLVLVGTHEGAELDTLDRDDLFVVREEIADDGESLALLDAYLDRRLAGWREDAETDGGSGQGGPARSGPMGEEEAYEVLGLASGASETDIRAAHRRLMKSAHPDSGGSTFLASKINEAKDVLLRSHS